MRKVFRLLMVLGSISILATGLYANGLNVNGVGPKANSMGGAFIAYADDYSAVYWNPAGLVQMKESSLTICGDLVFPKMSYDSSPFFSSFGLTDIDAQTKSKVYPIPFAGYFNKVSENLIIGLAIYAPSGIGAAWNGEDLTTLNFPDPTAYKWESTIMAITASPVIAYRVSDAFSIGLTLNLNYGMLDMNMPVVGQYHEKISGMGFGATIGALLKPCDFFSVGATVRLPSKVKLSGDATMDGAGLLLLATSSDAEREVTWPLWAGLGVAIRPTEGLTFTADAQYSKWGDLDKIDITYSDAFWQAAFGTGLTMPLAWEDTIQFRFGAEYMLNPGMAIRAGYYYDPAPGPLTHLNILLPSPDGGWLTFGLGMKTPKFNLDFSVEYNAFGKDRVADPAGVAAGTAMPGTHGAKILSIGFALTLNL